MKIYSWNVNGIRAVINKGAFQKFIDEANPDILCIQETKAKKGQAEIDLPEYEEIWTDAKRPGYSGTAIFTKIKPISTKEAVFSTTKEDQYGNVLDEGRVTTLEFKNFYLISVYTPNSKRDLSRLELRKNFWDPEFLNYLQELEQDKPVVVCGDFNAAHTEIDLARPKDNVHNAGFTAEEREGIENILKAGFIDTFRKLHPKEQRYTWWSHWANARANNVGWRIDYFFISPKLLPKLSSAEIHENFLGSDHCPISIDLKLED